MHNWNAIRNVYTRVMPTSLITRLNQNSVWCKYDSFPASRSQLQFVINLMSVVIVLNLRLCNDTQSCYKQLVITLVCSASVLKISVLAESSLRKSPRVSFSRHMSLMVFAVLDVSFLEWTKMSSWFLPACSMTFSYTISFITWGKESHLPSTTHYY